MRIDAHIHYTPPSLADNLAHFAKREPYWGLLVTPKANNQRSLQGWVTAERMIEDMDRADLDKVILVGEYFQQHESCVTRNDQALEIIKRWPERVIALATIQPKAGSAALDELKRCVEAGLHGVGELNPYAQGFDLNDPDFLRLIETCIVHDLPVNLHVSEEIGLYYPGKSTTPLRHYYWLAQRYPELKLILAHWGGGLFFYEIIPQVGQELKNVWYDTAASPLLYPTDKIFRVALQCLDHRKILYGSDYPLRIYPRRQQEPDLHHFIEEINALNLDRQVFKDIMGHNAAHLFGLLVQNETNLTAPPANPLQRFETAPGSIIGTMAISLVATAWPETQAVFEKYGIPWLDRAVPFWEPISQAAAARGWNPQAQQRLLAELNEAMSD
jgi:hypothetical protein